MKIIKKSFSQIEKLINPQTTMTLLPVASKENMIIQTKSTSGFTLSSAYIKAIILLSCAVLSFIIYDNGSILLNISYSTKIVQDKSQKPETIQNQNNNEPLANPPSIDSTLTSLKATAKQLSSSHFLESNLLGPNSLRTISTENVEGPHQLSMKKNEFKSDSIPVSSTQNHEVKVANDQTLTKIPKIVWLMSFPVSSFNIV